MGSWTSLRPAGMGSMPLRVICTEALSSLLPTADDGGVAAGRAVGYGPEVVVAHSDVQAGEEGRIVDRGRDLADAAAGGVDGLAADEGWRLGEASRRRAWAEGLVE